VNRDGALEAQLLERAKGSAELLDQVRARLAHTEAKHGNRGWEEKPVDELLAEAQEEAADIIGWAIGAGYKLDESGRCRLSVAMALAAAAWRELQSLREYLSVTGRLPAVPTQVPTPTGYRCWQCSDRHPGEPAAKLPRAGGQRVPICEDCLLPLMPPREELERFWLQSMKATAL
jgi:hypothetical protein